MDRNEQMSQQMLSESELGKISGGNSDAPSAKYTLGQKLRILKYDYSQTNGMTLTGGTVEQMQYANGSWQYILDGGHGISSNWLKEDELAPAREGSSSSGRMNLR